MRFLTQEEEEQRLAKETAQESTKWAMKSLRHVDKQSYMFRLLLEYARLVDGQRIDIGFRFVAD